MRAVKVEASDLERLLARVEARTADRRAGLYGPGSITWEVNRESVTMLGGGAAALLQLAHPHVAYAIEHHSKTRADPAGRFARTFESVFAMVFGDVDEAVEAARRVHAIHVKIRGRLGEDAGAHRRGDRYHANAPDALMWVHATLLDTALRVYELTVRRLSPLERVAYYEESKLFAYLFGIDDDAMPTDWPAFERYYRSAIEGPAIAVSAPARQMRAFLLRPRTALHAPAARWFEVLTAGLLPPKLRAAFELPFGPADRALFAATTRALRAGVRLSPPSLRYYPAYLEARRRIEGREGPAVVARWLESAATRALVPR